MGNCKLHPTDPNWRLEEGTVGKSLNLGKYYQLLLKLGSQQIRPTLA